MTRRVTGQTRVSAGQPPQPRPQAVTQLRNSGLSLAAACDGAHLTTAAGLGEGGELHPLQEAFIERDAFQCGYCTPGQLCSALGMLAEADAGHPSHVTAGLSGTPQLSEAEIRERLSGNLCRCGAYPNIVAAVRDVAEAR